MGVWEGPQYLPMTTTQSLASNDVTNTRWQRPCPGYFGFIYVQWKEVEMRRPYLHTVVVLFVVVSCSSTPVQLTGELDNKCRGLLSVGLSPTSTFLTQTQVHTQTHTCNCCWMMLYFQAHKNFKPQCTDTFL